MNQMDQPRWNNLCFKPIDWGRTPGKKLRNPRHITPRLMAAIFPERAGAVPPRQRRRLARGDRTRREAGMPARRCRRVGSGKRPAPAMETVNEKRSRTGRGLTFWRRQARSKARLNPTLSNAQVSSPAVNTCCDRVPRAPSSLTIPVRWLYRPCIQPQTAVVPKKTRGMSPPRRRNRKSRAADPCSGPGAVAGAPGLSWNWAAGFMGGGWLIFNRGLGMGQGYQGFPPHRGGNSSYLRVLKVGRSARLATAWPRSKVNCACCTMPCRSQEASYSSVTWW